MEIQFLMYFIIFIIAVGIVVAVLSGIMSAGAQGGGTQSFLDAIFGIFGR
jgi:hypothetical protein